MALSNPSHDFFIAVKYQIRLWSKEGRERVSGMASATLRSDSESDAHKSCQRYAAKWFLCLMRLQWASI